MKKLFCLVLALFLITVTACSNNKQLEISNASNLEDAVAYELEQIDKENNLDNETLKSLSIIIRTNLTLSGDFDNKNYSTSAKYIDLVNQTKNEILKINGNPEFIDISSDNYTWQKSIQKDKFLEYANNKNIALSNLSNIDPIYNDNIVEKLSVANKEFEYNELSKEFGLESNQITKIETTDKYIIIYGINKGLNKKFNINQASNLSNEGKNYKEIIKNLYKYSLIQ